MLASAVAKLLAGELVAFPTETVYGLGADCWNAVAVAKIFELKGRPRFDPLIAHVSDPDMAARLVAGELGPTASKLIEAFWPGPLTVVVPRDTAVPDIVSAGLNTIAIRCPDHSIALELIRQLDRPLAAPSANRFGKISPTTAGHVRDSFGVDAPFILDGGPCRVGVESTVVCCVGGQPRLLRPGGISLEDIERVIGYVELRNFDGEVAMSAPGMLKSHYAPMTPLEVIRQRPPAEGLSQMRAGLLSYTRPELTPIQSCDGFVEVRILSDSNDLRQAATNLFAALRELDALGLDRIFAVEVPETGLGRAIMDRLRRAAAKN